MAALGVRNQDRRLLAAFRTDQHQHTPRVCGAAAAPQHFDTTATQHDRKNVRKLILCRDPNSARCDYSRFAKPAFASTARTASTSLDGADVFSTQAEAPRRNASAAIDGSFASTTTQI